MEEAIPSREKFQKWITTHLAVIEETKRKQEEGLVVSGKDKQYALNVSLILQKYHRREEEIEQIRQEKTQKYREEFEEKMALLEKSLTQKHMVNIQSAIEKESHCK
jgi:hypothetical protein